MEAVIEKKDFIIISKYIKSLCGRKISYSKEYLINQKLKPILKRETFTSFHEFAQYIYYNNKKLKQLEDKIISAISVNETYFFRDKHPFDTLQNTLLKELFTKQDLYQNKLNIWSVACSTGQEPYSIAMTIENFKKENSNYKNIKYKILATDIDKVVLNYAKKGLYKQPDIKRGLNKKNLLNYFSKKENYWEVKNILKKNIKFHKYNLQKIHKKSIKKYDLIFLRNVLIYFDDDLRLEVLKFIEKKLKKGGYLFLGAAETLFGTHLLLKSITIGKTIVYKKE